LFCGQVYKGDLLIDKSLRYNREMIQKKIKLHIIKTCFATLSLPILAGCSTPQKQSEDLVTLQRTQIQNLKRQLKQQEKLIHELKTKDWVQRPVRPDENIAFKKLNQLVKDKQWALALKESSRLKKTYPDSVTLRTYRYKIFRKMGFADKAQQEQLRIRQIMAQQKSSSTKAL
jgi:hypothetical protein